MLFAGGGTLLLLIFLSQRERESCWLLSGYPADLPVVKAFFIVFFLPMVDIFAEWSWTSWLDNLDMRNV
jgi:hypothetical protein